MRNKCIEFINIKASSSIISLDSIYTKYISTGSISKVENLYSNNLYRRFLLVKTILKYNKLKIKRSK